MDDLAGKVAVVTGGAAGIGRGIVGALLDEGARVVMADIEAPVLERAVAELAARGDVRGVVTDVSDPASIGRWPTRSTTSSAPATSCGTTPG